MTRRLPERSAPPRRLLLPQPLRELFVLHAAPPRYRSAAIAAVCTVVPILWGQAAGQATLGLLGSTGALAALYGGRGTARQEAAVVGTAALGLTASIAIGSSLAGHRWYAVLGTALWAAVATAGAALIHARPPTTVMPVLLCAVSSGLPPGHGSPRILAVAATATAAAALSSIAALADRTPRAITPNHPYHPRSWRRDLSGLPSSPVPVMAGRAGLAVALAGAAALLCHTGRPYWAMATAGAVLAGGSHAANANRRALLRGTGTAAGCLLAAALAAAHPQGATVAIFLGALTFVIELVVARNYALAMIFVTPLSTILVTSATHTTAVSAVTVDRLVETVLGCFAAVVAGQLVTSRWAVRHRQRATAALLLAAADLLDEPARPDHVTAVHRAHHQLMLVSERTAGERRAVRTAVAALDHIAEAAVRVSEQTRPALHHPRHSDERRASELREIAALLDASTPHPTDAPQTSHYAELGAALDRWTRDAMCQPAPSRTTNRST